jgi:23S rRNA (guanine745-N1)-methyltransferase
MVAAREAFLGAGHYAPIASAVATAARAGVIRAGGLGAGVRATGSAAESGGGIGCVVDLGAGTGHYLAAVLRELAGWSGLALDASRPALRRAVRADPRIAGVVCDAWRRLPVADGGADVVLSVFAPRNAGEIARILAAAGTVVVVTPTVDHLRELVGRLGLLNVDPAKPARIAAQLEGALRPLSSEPVEFDLVLDRAAAGGVAGMGPSAHHVEAGVLASRVAALPEPIRVTASVVVQTFARRPAA